MAILPIGRGGFRGAGGPGPPPFWEKNLVAYIGIHWSGPPLRSVSGPPLMKISGSATDSE